MAGRRPTRAMPVEVSEEVSDAHLPSVYFSVPAWQYTERQASGSATEPPGSIGQATHILSRSIPSMRSTLKSSRRRNVGSAAGLVCWPGRSTASGAALGLARNCDGFAAEKSAPRATCAAADDISRPLGDPLEASLRTALDFVAGRSCTPVVVAQTAQSTSTRTERRVLPVPADARAAQREVPGLF